MTKRRAGGPPKLTPGEMLLLGFRSDCSTGSVAAKTPAAARRLETLSTAAARILNGDDPSDALGFERAPGARSKYWRDLEIARYIYSEKVLRNRPWKQVTPNVNRWLGREYGENLSQSMLMQIYAEFRDGVEEWQLLFEDLSREQ